MLARGKCAKIYRLIIEPNIIYKELLNMPYSKMFVIMTVWVPVCAVLI